MPIPSKKRWQAATPFFTWRLIIGCGCGIRTEMYRSNVDGTRAILEAARKNGVRRVVYTSSVATMGFTSNGHPADEDSPVALADMIGHYKRSKFMAEQVALEAGRSGMHVVMVNPTTPVGEQDVKPTPTGRIVVDFLKRKFPAYVETGLNLVDVTECARTCRGAGKGKPGERYILGGENLTLKQILDKLAAITGLPSPTLKVPYFMALVREWWTSCDRANSWAGAPRDHRRCAHGAQENVRFLGQGRARTRLENTACRSCAEKSDRLVSSKWICLSSVSSRRSKEKWKSLRGRARSHTECTTEIP